MIAARHKDELPRREPERAASGVHRAVPHRAAPHRAVPNRAVPNRAVPHRAVPHRDWTAQAIADEAACARPTNWAPPPDVETPTSVAASPVLGSFEADSLEAEAFEAELELEVDEVDDPSREIAWAHDAIDELSAQVVAESERRSLLESELDEALHALALCEQRLQEMSRSHYDTLSALRRAYEQRLCEASDREG